MLIISFRACNKRGNFVVQVLEDVYHFSCVTMSDDRRGQGMCRHLGDDSPDAHRARRSLHHNLMAEEQVIQWAWPG